MAFWNKYPYTNFHELNLDWLVEEVKKLGTQVDKIPELVAASGYSFADPVEWSSDREYKARLIVTHAGASYVSIADVPANIPITDTAYWAKIADYNVQVNNLETRVESLERVNVKTYGAVGDGVTDDTVSIQTAITYVGGINGEVYFPAGTYLTSGIIVPSYTALIGENKEAVTLKLNAVGDAVIKSQNFDNLSGTGSLSGAAGVTIKNISIDGNRTQNNISTGIKKYGYRWVVENVDIANCAIHGIYSEWSTYEGDPEDGKYMEDMFTNVRVHHCGYGITNNGAHDSYFSDILVYLNDGYGYISNVSDKYSGAGASIVNMHAYANGSDGIILNAQTNAVNLISESNNAQAGTGSGGRGIVVNASNCLLDNVYAYTNLNGAAIHLNAGYCTIKGRLSNNQSGIDVESDGGLNIIDLVVYSATGQKCYTDRTVFNNLSNWSIKGTGDDFKIVKRDMDEQAFWVRPLSGSGADNKYTNTRDYPIVCYQTGGSDFHLVDSNGNSAPCPASGTIVIMPGTSVYWDTASPTAWMFKPLIT